jgi:hypothetical protein
MSNVLDGIPMEQKGVPDWQNGADDTDEVAPQTLDAANFTYTYVLPNESCGDVAKRCYGNNNVINRLRLELANNGNVFGFIRVPR